MPYCINADMDIDRCLGLIVMPKYFLDVGNPNTRFMHMGREAMPESQGIDRFLNPCSLAVFPDDFNQAGLTEPGMSAFTSVTSSLNCRILLALFRACGVTLSAT